MERNYFKLVLFDEAAFHVGPDLMHDRQEGNVRFSRPSRGANQHVLVRMISNRKYLGLDAIELFDVAENEFSGRVKCVDFDQFHVFDVALLTSRNGKLCVIAGDFLGCIFWLTNRITLEFCFKKIQLIIYI